MDNKEILDQLRSRIWITERCHMHAEKRSRFLELYFHIVLALFAFATISISIWSATAATAMSDSVLTLTAIATLCLSLLIFGFKFGEIAAQHRSCYLGLQRLRLGEYSDAAKLNKDYIELLGYFPNHSKGDYYRLAMTNIFLAEQGMTTPNGDKARFGIWNRMSYAFYWISIRFFIVIFGLLPAALFLFGTGFWGSAVNSP